MGIILSGVDEENSVRHTVKYIRRRLTRVNLQGLQSFLVKQQQFHPPVSVTFLPESFSPIPNLSSQLGMGTRC